MATLHRLPRPDFTHLADIRQRGRVFQHWEKLRHRQAHWFVACLAEMLGVFLYVFMGAGATAPFVIGGLTNQTTLGSLFQIGCAYAIGIVLAVVICGPTSGGHFNPAMTICNMIFKKFPVRRGLMYIVAQILGGYIAALLIYIQYRHLVLEVKDALIAKGVFHEVFFTPQGPGGIFAFYAAPGSSLGQMFINEFVCDFVIGLTLWGALDPSNFFAPPAVGPWVVAFAYGACVWGYAPVGISLNSARDVGGRLAALTLWGTQASGGRYAAIAALTNLFATPLAVLFYEFVLADSSRVIPSAQAEFFAGHLAHEEHSGQGEAHPGSPSSSLRDEKDGVAMHAA